MPARKIWKISKAGSIDRLRLASEETPPLQAGEGRVRVYAVGLNFADVFALQGLYSATPRGEFTPGLEFAGVIEEIAPGGRGAPRFKRGDRVIGVTRFGGYSERINVDLRYLRALPRGWDFAEGAALIAQGLTAWYALARLGAASAGQSVLVHSAAGGVGLLALDMIAKLKLHPIAVVGGAEKVAFLKERAGLRDAQILLRNPQSFAADLDRALSAEKLSGFDLILDSVAGEYFRPGYDRLNPAGRLILFGSATMMTHSARPNYLEVAWRYLRRPRLDPLEMMSANKSLMAFNLIWLWDRVDELMSLYDSMMRLKLRPPHIGRRFAFERAPEAIAYFQSGASVGKVVLEL